MYYKLIVVLLFEENTINNVIFGKCYKTFYKCKCNKFMAQFCAIIYSNFNKFAVIDNKIVYFVILVTVIMLTVIMLNVILLNVEGLNKLVRLNLANISVLVKSLHVRM